MQIADSLLEGITRLALPDAGRVWEFVARFRKEPARVGTSLERVTRALDRNLWSGRVSQDLRAILHREGETWTLLYVGHHDAAYGWAERRRVERHLTTGALQIVELPEAFEHDLDQAHGRFDRAGAAPLLHEHADDYLLSLGVPPVWLPTLRRIRTDDELELAANRLPEEVGERLLLLAAGEFVTPPPAISLQEPAMSSPDTQRRFFLLDRDDDLHRMLESPFALWLVFLHPSQRNLAHGTFAGPVKVTGSAGTGKTVVAMHRAVHLAGQGKRVLLTSLVTTLCHNLERNLRLFGDGPWKSKLTVSTLDKTALDLVRRVEPQAQPVNYDQVEALLKKHHGLLAATWDLPFLLAEWNAVIEPQDLQTWEAYRDASRAGRSRPLGTSQRKELWSVFEGVLQELDGVHSYTWAQLCARATTLLMEGSVESPFDACVVDELQDLGRHHLRLVAALAGTGPDSMMLVGDGGQRIYAAPTSLSSCGINVRGRSHVLRLNYRTTEQIRRLADRVIGDASDDLDAGRESRKGTRNLLWGPDPALHGFATADQQTGFLAEQIRTSEKGGVALEDMAVFARTNRLVDALLKAMKQAGLPAHRLSNEDDADDARGVRFTTMHRAKGLEFKAVFVADASADQLPLRSLLDRIYSPEDREDAMACERQLLYVSLTRARDELYVTWVGKPSPFLELA